MVGFPVSDTTAVFLEPFQRCRGWSDNDGVFCFRHYGSFAIKRFQGGSDDGRVSCFSHDGSLLGALRKVPRIA